MWKAFGLSLILSSFSSMASASPAPHFICDQGAGNPVFEAMEQPNGEYSIHVSSVYDTVPSEYRDVRCKRNSSDPFVLRCEMPATSTPGVLRIIGLRKIETVVTDSDSNPSSKVVYKFFSNLRIPHYEFKPEQCEPVMPQI